MNIQFHYQGTSGSPWMNEYMKGKLERLERYIPQNALVTVDLITGSLANTTRLTIRSNRQVHTFQSDGADLFEAFTTVLEEALRFVRFEHQKILNWKVTRSEMSS